MWCHCGKRTLEFQVCETKSKSQNKLQGLWAIKKNDRGEKMNSDRSLSTGTKIYFKDKTKEFSMASSANCVT